MYRLGDKTFKNKQQAYKYLVDVADKNNIIIKYRTYDYQKGRLEELWIRVKNYY